ncbi:MAG TPA: PstS family phosphate ABC transporter substrate-binding protein [Vicinamibacterales bacterium]|nr:PstS family phosphate ABC transporter substrate-binding protein [Vicinamibacterales bacterium]
MTVACITRLLPFALITLLAGCGGGSNQPPRADGTAAPSDIKVDGSSTVFVVSEAVAEEFQKVHKDMRVTVGQSGTGGGFQKFCRGETDVSDASRPIRPTELTACKAAGIDFFEVPIAYDGIAIVVSPKATWVNDITTDELKMLWSPDAQGKVMKWSQVRKGWPDREIHLFGAGVDSGTYDYFTEALTGKEGASRGDFTSSEDDNVLVQGVSGDELALGFLPFAYYNENKTRLKLVPVDNKKAEDGAGPIAPDFDTIRTGNYQPLSRPLFIYVSEKSLARPEVQQFMDFYIANVGKLAQEVGYVQLGDEGYRLVAEHFKARKPGTIFGEGGSQVGVTIEQLLAKERQ